MIELDLEGADILFPEGFARGVLSLAQGRIVADRVGRTCDLQGYLVLPGIVDMHGDAFERHVAPRRGAMTQTTEGIHAAEAEVAANGISTAVLAQFISWEGGLRGFDFADRVFSAMRDTRADLVTDLRPQLRLETHLTEAFEDLPDHLARWGVNYLVFNDHLPHARLSQGKKPPRLTGQALKAGRNPEAHFQLLLELHARKGGVPEMLDALCERLLAQGILLGSHDDSSAVARQDWRARGVKIAEFPETREAAESARQAGEAVVLGAPNLVRGGSHKGNVSARDLIADGLCTALASDYHYPSLRRAAFTLVDEKILDLASAWRLLSSGPAQALGLEDRGVLAAGRRADLVILDAQTRRVAATMSGGRFSFVAGDLADRLIAA